MKPTATGARDVSREPVQGAESKTTGRRATAKERHGGCTERTIQGKDRPVGTRKTRCDMTERATGPTARAPSGGKTRNRARGEGRQADVVARVRWDLLPAQEGNDGLVERAGRCYACLVGWAAAQAGQASGKQGSTHSNAGKRALSAVEPKKGVCQAGKRVGTLLGVREAGWGE